MKKNKKIIVIGAIFLALIIYIVYINGYDFRLFKNTPEKYRSETQVTSQKYTSDSLKLVNQMHSLIKEHKESFYSGEYDNSTQIIIDTIMYSSDFNRITFFVITKNPVKKLSKPEKNYQWYYDATCYIGQRIQDSFNLKWVGPNYTNSYDLEHISKEIENYFFKKRASEPAYNGEKKYNINDTRYWTSSDWKNLNPKK
ncbi:hypothetical protein [Chryseobacterium tongliaoense]|uniref:hypothetical protein n=1 Tax=Chryseobacterium tongliaoense TaxID=3240933 RepID=UPI003516ABA1